MSHLPVWERMGLTYREYADGFERAYLRALGLARAGMTPLEASRKALQEVAL